MLAIFLEIISHRFILLSVFIILTIPLFALLKMLKSRILFILLFLIYVFVILNTIFGSHFYNYLVNRYGVEGKAVITHSEDANFTYNRQPVFREHVLIKTAEGEFVESYFETSDFNIYPRPEDGVYSYPLNGVEFKVKYLPDDPSQFIIVNDPDSAYGLLEICNDISQKMQAAKKKMDFASDNADYGKEYETFLQDYNKKGCNRNNQALFEAMAEESVEVMFDSMELHLDFDN